MTLPSPSSQSQNALSLSLVQAFEELAGKLMADPLADPDELLAEYTEHAEQLRSMLPAMQLLADAGSFDATGVSAPSLQPPRTDATVGDFRILREIGRGGMGIVYEAEQLSLRRKVALKILPYAGLLDPRQIARFENEVRAAATLEHPHIVPVYAVGDDRGVHFYAMRLIRGASLAELIAALRPGKGDRRQAAQEKNAEKNGNEQTAESDRSLEHSPSTMVNAAIKRAEFDTVAAALTTEYSTNPKRYFRRVAEIGLQIAEALDHAHEHGILHRDVKPANILLGDEGKAWITDFGLARLESEASVTATGDLLGTLRYMSPEQVNGSRADVSHGTDIYSLGITLYELATGIPAFAGQDRHTLLRRIVEDQPTSPRQVRPQIPQDLETIILKSIEKDPHDRYVSAAELANDLRRYTRNETIRARRPSLATCARRWTGRYRAVVATTVASLLVVLSLVAAVQWQARTRVEDALAEVRAKNQQLEEAQRRTKHSLAIARQAVDEMYVEFADEWLNNQPQMTQKQIELLKEAAKVYESLTEEFPTDYDLKLKTAVVIFQSLHCENNAGPGKHSSAYPEIAKKALSLADEAANHLQLSFEQAFNLAYVKVVYHTLRLTSISATDEDRSAAFAAAVAAVQLLEQVAKGDTKDPEAIRKLAVAQGNIAGATDGDVSREYGRRAVETADRLVALQPSQETSIFRLAYSLRRLSDFDLAITVRAIEVAERVHRDWPSHGSKKLLAMNLWHAVANSIQGYDGIDTLHRVVRLYEELTKDFPYHELHWHGLKVQYVSLVTELLKQGDFVQAEQFAEKLIEVGKGQVARNPSHEPFFRDTLNFLDVHAAILWLCDKPEAARSALEKAAAFSNAGSQSLADRYLEAGSFLLRAAKNTPQPQLRAKMTEIGLALLEHSADNWDRNELIYRHHPDVERAKQAYLWCQAQLRAIDAKEPDWDHKLYLARQQLARVFPQSSDDREVFVLLQQAYEEGGKDDDDIGVLACHGWAFFRGQRFDEALTWFQRAEAHDKFATDIDAVSGMALTQLKLSNVDTAREYYDRVVAIARNKAVIERPIVSILQEVAAAFDDEATIQALIQDRWPAAAMALPGSTGPR